MRASFHVIYVVPFGFQGQSGLLKTFGTMELPGIQCHGELAHSPCKNKYVQVDVDALKAKVVAHPAAHDMPYTSSNDILMALAWMLTSDISGTARPGQGPAGSRSTALIGIDLARNGLPADLQPLGSVGNLSRVGTAVCVCVCDDMPAHRQKSIL